MFRLFLFLATATVLACTTEEKKSASAASVQHAVTETQLTTITLAPEAVRRLGIETATVDSVSVAPTRTIGGEVIVPPGQTFIVSAPVASTVLSPEHGNIPTIGSRVGIRHPLMRLVALPPDRDLLRIQQDVIIAEARLRQAQAEADRVSTLYADRLISTRDRDAVDADLAVARASAEAAIAQQRFVRGGADSDAAGLSPILMVATAPGIVRALYAAAGQAVAAGAPLAEIVRLDRLWVRVPVYAGDAARIARTGTATVHGLAGAQSGTTFRARPVAAPPSADPMAASVDFYYEIDGATLRPGERVGVTLPLSADTERALVVPLTAIVRDMSGGSWVYERIDSVTFARRRVEVARVADTRAILTVAPPSGTPVVTAGVAELFGTEFGPGK